MNKHTTLLAVVISASLALAACGSNESATPAAPEATPAAAPADTATPAEAAPEAMASEPAAPPAEPATTDGIRGKGGLEEKCQERVAKETGATVTGTNRIEESEAAIEIYVNVEGAQAPWKCLGNKDGTISEVMYTGDEGAA